jgi:capsular exopolysaccharide synthesis family protein
MSKTFEALQKAEKEKIPLNTKRPNKNNKTSLTNFNLDVRIIEELKNMKFYIRSISDQKLIRTILFTSSNPGEGTSTILVNFAKEIAASGEKVIIIDTNLRNPILHKLLNVENIEGVAEAIDKRKPLIETIKKTATENLRIITHGKQSEGTLAGFSSDTMKPIINELKSHADWILFDSPPIHQYSDAAVLANEVDGVIMVVQAEKTKWEVAQSARDKIKKENTQILGAILNKKQFHIPNLIYKLFINR